MPWWSGRVEQSVMHWRFRLAARLSCCLSEADCISATGLVASCCLTWATLRIAGGIPSRLSVTRRFADPVHRLLAGQSLSQIVCTGACETASPAMCRRPRRVAWQSDPQPCSARERPHSEPNQCRGLMPSRLRPDCAQLDTAKGQAPLRPCFCFEIPRSAQAGQIEIHLVGLAVRRPLIVSPGGHSRRSCATLSRNKWPHRVAVLARNTVAFG